MWLVATVFVIQLWFLPCSHMGFLPQKSLPLSHSSHQLFRPSFNSCQAVCPPSMTPQHLLTAMSVDLYLMVPTICSENPQAFAIAWQTVPSESCIVAQERDTFIFHPKSRGWNHQLQRVQYVPDVLQFAIIDTWINVLNSPAEPALLATSYPWRLHPRVIQGPSQQAIKHSGYLSTKT